MSAGWTLNHLPAMSRGKYDSGARQSRWTTLHRDGVFADFWWFQGRWKHPTDELSKFRFCFFFFGSLDSPMFLPKSPFRLPLPSAVPKVSWRLCKLKDLLVITVLGLDLDASLVGWCLWGELLHWGDNLLSHGYIGLGVPMVRSICSVICVNLPANWFGGERLGRYMGRCLLADFCQRLVPQKMEVLTNMLCK